MPSMPGWRRRSKRAIIKKPWPQPLMIIDRASCVCVAPCSAHSRASGNPESAEDRAKELGPRFRGDEWNDSGYAQHALAAAARWGGADVRPVALARDRHNGP